jgi:non-canonical purine NTP pyrophosphatase (RdgB/HAM1 family)
VWVGDLRKSLEKRGDSFTRKASREDGQEVKGAVMNRQRYKKMKKQLLIATRNPGKAREFAQLLGDTWTIKTLLDFPELPEVVEDGETFEANAIKKAVEISTLMSGYVLADDSGLEVEALNGAPGVYSARYAGEHGNDAANNEKLLREMKGLPEDRRGGQFRCVLALAQEGLKLNTMEGLCLGRIAHEITGTQGFGYDALFIPDRHTNTFGELSPEVKHTISHRAKATRAMIRVLSLR